MDSCIYEDFVATDERTPTRSVVYEATCKGCGQKIRGRKGDMLKATVCRHVGTQTTERETNYATAPKMYSIAGRTLSGRKWAKELGRAPDFINKYCRKYGKDATSKLIEDMLKRGDSAYYERL